MLARCICSVRTACCSASVLPADASLAFGGSDWGHRVLIGADGNDTGAQNAGVSCSAPTARSTTLPTRRLSARSAVRGGGGRGSGVDRALLSATLAPLTLGWRICLAPTGHC
jgi:hypothetical protein